MFTRLGWGWERWKWWIGVSTAEARRAQRRTNRFLATAEAPFVTVSASVDFACAFSCLPLLVHLDVFLESKMSGIALGSQAAQAMGLVEQVGVNANGHDGTVSGIWAGRL